MKSQNFKPNKKKTVKDWEGLSKTINDSSPFIGLTDGEDKMSPIEVMEEKFASLYVSLERVVKGIETMRDVHVRWPNESCVNRFMDILIDEGKRALEVCK